MFKILKENIAIVKTLVVDVKAAIAEKKDRNNCVGNYLETLIPKSIKTKPKGI